MLKHPHEVKLERAALEQIQNLLTTVPFIKLNALEQEQREHPEHENRPDILVKLKAHQHTYRLICEVKSSGQPRHVRLAIAQLRSCFNQNERNTYAVVIAPYLSPAAQQICLHENVGFLDFEGNCRLVFNGVFIERIAPPKSPTVRRELKSIFAPKSAQVLRVLMRNPSHQWKLTDLAATANVSLGHVSNVRSGLIDREWASVGPEGLFLTNPDSVLNNWRDIYKSAPGKQLSFYTTLHGSFLQERIRSALEAANAHGRATLSSFSAAQWLAPYARTGTHYFYANEQGLQSLQDSLRLSPTTKGENIAITQLDDDELFNDTIEPAPDIRCTSPVQTYLDLFIAGERGKEAAEHLRAEKLKW